MIATLYGFYMGALEAELSFAPDTEFSHRMAAFYCRMILALESAA